jgi:hypothetical protein
MQFFQLSRLALVLYSSVNETRQQLSCRLTSAVRQQYQSRSHVTMSDSCDLTTWAQRHISAIYEAQSEDDLHHAFEAAFSPSLETFVNHEQMSRESIKDDMVQRRAAAISSSVNWENVMVVPKNPEKPDEVCLLCKISLQDMLMLWSGWHCSGIPDRYSITQIPHSRLACTTSDNTHYQRQVTDYYYRPIHITNIF